MAYLDPQEAFEHLQGRVLDGIQAQFPNGELRGKIQTLKLDKLDVQDDLHPDDLRGQHKAKVEGDTWAVPVYAHFTLVDNDTGKVRDTRRVRIAEIPKTTSRYSYIVSSRDGAKEYQVASQWQLKPGAYTRRRSTGVLESHFNVTGRRAFDVSFDPAKKTFALEYNKAQLPIYPLLQTLGVSDESMKTAWGDEVFQANRGARSADTALEKFYRTAMKAAPPSKEVAADLFFTTMQESKMRPEATALTLG